MADGRRKLLFVICNLLEAVKRHKIMLKCVNFYFHGQEKSFVLLLISFFDF